MVPLHSGPLRLLSVVQVCLFSPSSHSSYSSSLSFLLLLQWDKETQNKRRFQNHTHNVFYLAVQVNDPAESCCWLVCKICECSKVSRKGIVLKLCIIPSLSEHTPSHLFSFPDWKGKRKKKKKAAVRGEERSITHLQFLSACLWSHHVCSEGCVAMDSCMVICEGHHGKYHSLPAPSLSHTHTGVTYIYHYVNEQMASMANSYTLQSHLNKKHFPVFSAYDASAYACDTIHLHVLFPQ